MSVATKLQSHAKPALEPRAILGPGGNRDRAPHNPKCKPETLKKTEKQSKALPVISELVIRDNVSVGSSCSSDSLSSNYSVKLLKPYAVKPVSAGGDSSATTTSPALSLPGKRCDWITLHSDPLYIAFHDEEWGVPVHDDKKLFELLVLSQALAELTWPLILSKRDIFRKVLNDFDPSSIAQFKENEFTTLKVNGIQLLSEPKLRAIVENANQVLKIQKEFGSFSNYCWSFVNKKPIRNRFRYNRQVPVKTPKAEFMSKDMMRRGFRCVGPTVVYSFMQVAGIVNDHLANCFRYEECDTTKIKDDKKLRVEDKR
ncbi:putative GMP synthase [Cucumis melo var. makuwa]|uniref:GMP synthase n=1 Tax=Cucumis melo var. makuwa TaxID=1194695 RepID=A0A5D3BFN8_CUCMM|nr:putative GMP synthase [Cucumis melo var. makuwa]TYJ97937.1 putative GMP synthase [Cucumis melo var. makuwa]